MDSAERESLPWVEKYRPTSLDQIACHGGAVETIRRFLAEHRLPHLFLYGPPGTGKTSTAGAIAAALHGAHWRSTGRVLELNASDERGIDAVREQIKTFCAAGVFQSTANTVDAKPAPKLVILDEADAMTTAAQNALRRIIEKYVQRVRFIIIGNYAGQIIPALQSRCTKFRFVPLDRQAMVMRTQHVIEAERLHVSDEAVQALIDLAEGDMRKVLNWLQAAHNSKQTLAVDNCSIVTEDIYAVAAAANPSDLADIWRSALTEDFGEAYGKARNMQANLGFSGSDLVKFFARQLMSMGDVQPWTLAYGLSELAAAEQRLAAGCNEDLQLAAILSITATIPLLEAKSP
jgi:replication factor C subunit 3/5